MSTEHSHSLKVPDAQINFKYQVNPTDDFFIAIWALISANQKVRRVSNEFIHLQEDFIKLIEKVLFYSSSIVEPTDVQKV